MSFSAGTRVLLASGAAIPISQLKPGDKVLATNVRTGKTQAEPVASVLVQHDTDRYDLTVKTSDGSAVIQTTSSHLFWDVTQHRWVKAAALNYGDTLRTSDGIIATAAGGYIPATAAGWMWDLTVPGNGDHDFYIDVATAAVLVHNCGPDELNYNQVGNRIATHVDPLHGYGTPAEGTKFAGGVGEDDMLNMVNEVNPANETGLANMELGTREHIIPWEGAGAGGENWVRIWMGESGTLGSMWPIAGG
jgi:Pretoxin HINT domain